MAGSDRKHGQSWLVCVNQRCNGTAVGIVTGPRKGLGSTLDSEVDDHALNRPSSYPDTA